MFNELHIADIQKIVVSNNFELIIKNYISFQAKNM